MPGGFGEPLQGVLAFTAIKFAGYSLAAFYLNKSYPNANGSNFLVVGFTRTIIGIVFGVVLATVSFPFVFAGGLGFLIYLFGLIPVRLLEWFILLGFFYEDAVTDKQKMWKHLSLLTAWSFVLDIPALAGLSLLGNFWIC